MQEMKNRWAIVFSPKGGTTKADKIWSKIEPSLREKEVLYDLFKVKRDKVSSQVDSLLEGGYKTIVVVGGDTELSEAANSIMSLEEKERESIALGVIPSGNTNDFAHYWGYSEASIDKTISWLKNHRIRKVDVGLITYQSGEDKEKEHRYFLNCVNIGLVSSILNLRQETHRLLGSKTLSFLASMILVIFQRLDYLVKLTINSQKITHKIMTMCVGNALGYGLTPHAVPYNGMLDVSIVYQTEITQLLECIYLFWTGKLLNHRNVHPFRTRLLEIEDSSKAMVSVDGKMLPTPIGEYSITVEQEAINFLIPD